MRLIDLLPTRKVTAFAFGGAIVLVGLWLLVDVAEILGEWPEGVIVGSMVIIVGAICAWLIPEGAWRRLQGQIDTDTEGGDG